eukprot:scaffold55358_cov28-Prasinocladus_malaysianus.AAC.2
MYCHWQRRTQPLSALWRWHSIPKNSNLLGIQQRSGNRPRDHRPSRRGWLALRQSWSRRGCRAELRQQQSGHGPESPKPAESSPSLYGWRQRAGDERGRWPSSCGVAARRERRWPLPLGAWMSPHRPGGGAGMMERPAGRVGCDASARTAEPWPVATQNVRVGVEFFTEIAIGWNSLHSPSNA